MKIEKWAIDKINPAVYNPRKDLRPDDIEYKKLKKSIKFFGFVEPLVVNKDGALIGGHQRLKILKEEGFEEVDVSVVDLNKRDEKALNVALNKISGEWDLPNLKDLLEELDSGDYDLTLTGFGLDEIEELLTSYHKTDLSDIDINPPDLCWVLIGVPVKDYPKVQQAINPLAELENIIIEVSVSNEN